jgi:hypothetical protein
MENQIQFAPLLDSIFSELEASARFEIHCKIQSNKSAPAWPPSLEVISVNGAASLRDYLVEMISLYMRSLQSFMTAFNKVEPARRTLFFREAVAEGLGFVENHLPLIDVFKKEGVDGSKHVCTCFFTHARCFIDGAETTDPMLILQALLKTNLYARAWYKLVKSVSSMLTCTSSMVCQDNPLQPAGNSYYMPFANDTLRIPFTEP